MLIKTEGIVFKTIKYSETSRIIKIFTKDNGLQTYILKGVKSKKSKYSPALLSNLNLLEIDSYYNPKKEIQILKEAKLAHQYRSIPFDIAKSSVVLFLNEILYKTIKEEEQNLDLYKFIKTALLYFDETEGVFNDFHIFFLTHLTKHLGFFPKLPANEEEIFFSLPDGYYIPLLINERTTLNKEQSNILKLLCKEQISYFYENPIKRDLRNEFMLNILKYYSLHIHNFNEIKSLDVLKSIFA